MERKSNEETGAFDLVSNVLFCTVFVFFNVCVLGSHYRVECSLKPMALAHAFSKLRERYGVAIECLSGPPQHLSAHTINNRNGKMMGCQCELFLINTDEYIVCISLPPVHPMGKC
jgi:hypothetical protein